MLAGWNDFYVDPAFRIQERCTGAARRTLVGSWVHSYPDDAYPGPNLDWLHEMVRFFDRYLKGIDNGWEREPALTWFEHEWAEPEAFPAAWPGRWRAGAAFPVPGTTTVSLAHLGRGDSTGSTRRPATPAGRRRPIRHSATAGTSGALSWGAGWHPNGLARDLRPDEARGATWTSEPLAAPLDVIGIPAAVLHVSATMPVADVRRPPVRGVPGRRLGPGLDGRPQPHPPPLGHGPGAGLEPGVDRGGHRSRCAPPGTGSRPATASASPSSRATGRRCGPRRFPGALHVHHGPAAPSRPTSPALPDAITTPDPPAFKLTPPRLREVGESEDEPAVWRIEEDVINGTVAVTIGEGGASILEDGSRVYSLGAAGPDRVRRPHPGPRAAGFRCHLPLDRRRLRRGDQARRAGSCRTRTPFDVRVDLGVRLDGEPFFARGWSDRIRAGWGDGAGAARAPPLPGIRPLRPRRPPASSSRARRRRGDQPLLDRLQPLPGRARALDRPPSGSSRRSPRSRGRSSRSRRAPLRTGSAGASSSRGLAVTSSPCSGCSAARPCPLIVLAAACGRPAARHSRSSSSPYMTEHSEPAHRNELFAMQFAIQNVTNIVAAVLGGVVATAIAAALGLPPGGPGTYRIILVIMACSRRPAGRRDAALRRPAARRSLRSDCGAWRARRVPARPAPLRAWLGITIRDRARFVKLLLPGFLISLGAGQMIPFLNLFIQAQVRAEPRVAQRRLRPDRARHARRDPLPAPARPAVRPDHVGRARPGRPASRSWSSWASRRCCGRSSRRWPSATR